MRLRTRFSVADDGEHGEEQQEEVELALGVEAGCRTGSAGGTSIEACAPPEIAGTWLMVHSMMSWPASVAMAR